MRIPAAPAGDKRLFPTKESLHELKRQAVLREAANAFNLKGYHATSLSEIANNLGVTKAALYYYFPNKNCLLLACFEKAMEVAFASLADGERQGRNGREKLLLTLSNYLSQIMHELNSCVVLMEEQALQPDDHVKMLRKRDKFERALRALVREGIADGSIVPCDPKLVIFSILGALNWVPKWFRPQGGWKPEQIAHAQTEFFERALSSKPGAAMAADVGAIAVDGRSEARLFGRRPARLANAGPLRGRAPARKKKPIARKA